MSQAQVPAAVAGYFGCGRLPHAAGLPDVVVDAIFVPGRGWVSQRHYRKRISGAWARKLRRDGATFVALRYGRRVADFAIQEATR